jgi:DNA repair protein RadC
MKLNSIKNWAEEDRPREKLIQKGRSSLSDAELLAILIGSGSRKLSAVQLSREILAGSKNSLEQLSKKSVSDLMKFNGIGEAKAITIYSAMEIARRRSTLTVLQKQSVKSSRDAFNYLRGDLSDLGHEEFYSLFLNRANEIIGSKLISKGGISGTVADGKIIFHEALELKSSAIILAHNHPSGRLIPSKSDINLTNSLVNFGKFIDLHVLDHLIFCDNNYFSFADEGLIN